MNYKNILAESNGNILTITINRPEKLNALNKETLAELNMALTDALNDATVGGMIITGAGEKAFVAGADISGFADYNQEQAKELANNGHSKIFDLIADASKPIIAAINGFALGGGLELALACHIRFCSENAKLGLPEVSLGIIPGYGGTQRLTELVGKGKAFEMILSADMIDASEALEIGLVNNVFYQDSLLAESERMLNTILSRSSNAVASAIKAINAFNHTKDGYHTEIELFSRCFNSKDFKEGVDAFLKKRKPNFK